jgi:hypothetical protein
MLIRIDHPTIPAEYASMYLYVSLRDAIVGLQYTKNACCFDFYKYLWPSIQLQNPLK